VTLQQAANRNDVREAATVFGYARQLSNTAPKEVSTNSSGGGSVSFNRNGAAVEPGTTGGDFAAITGTPHDEWRAPISRVIIGYRHPNNAPADDFNIGFVPSTIDDTTGSYIDLETQEFVSGAQRTDASSFLSFGSNVQFVEIVENRAENHTQFWVQGELAEQIEQVDDVASTNRVLGSSNGNGDNLLIPFLQESYHGTL